VLIPTKLDPGSANAVPRTIQWLNSLANMSWAKLVGVVANQAGHRDGALVKADQNSYRYLQELVANFSPGPDVVFASTVKADRSVVPLQRGVVPAVDAGVRALFEPFLAELRSRVNL
jgi:hypothetical protein